MDSSYITPFIVSSQNVFETMLQMPVHTGEPQRKTVGEPAYDVSAIIGMSGGVDGAVVLSFPTETAQRVVQLFTATEKEPADEEVADALGELVNMITGGAKAMFPHKQVAISCPSVVVGRSHVVFGGKDVVCIAIPCQCDCGEFSVEVSFRNAAALQAAPSQDATALA